MINNIKLIDKGDLLEIGTKALEGGGYEVKVFNLKDSKISKWNPLKE